MLRDELWETITKPITVPIPCSPEEPFLFPIFQWVDTFLCFACMERRLGRQLTQEDLNKSAWNVGWIDYVCDASTEPESVARRRARGRRLLPHSSVRERHKGGGRGDSND
jgi:hypothetical protein